MKRGRIPFYIKQLIELEEKHPPDRPARVYDSSLSKPGRICSTSFCRAFVPGGVARCSSCGATDAV